MKHEKLIGKTALIGQAGKLGTFIKEVLREDLGINAVTIGEDLNRLAQLAGQYDCLIVHIPQVQSEEAGQLEKRLIEKALQQNDKLLLLTHSTSKITSDIENYFTGQGVARIQRDITDLDEELVAGVIGLFTNQVPT